MRWLLIGMLGAAGCSTSSSPPLLEGPLRDGGASSDGAAGSAPDGPPAWLGLAGDRLAALPPQTNATSAHFATSDACAGCHTANETALRDASGRDISPVTTFRPSMMSLAARDPFYLAAVRHEIDTHPTLTSKVEETCTRCHAPAASVELALAGSHLTFAELTSGMSPEAVLARDGVGCTVCHQIQESGLGTRARFTGKFTIGDGRLLYGPFNGPDTQPMSLMVNYTPTYGQHIGQSRLCGSCHTVITQALDSAGNVIGPQFVEQAAYLEWQNSAYSDEAGGARAQPCQGCHLPQHDEDGAAISTAIATRPTTLQPRTPLGRHSLLGGNAYMLRLLADNRDWAGPFAPAAALAAQADATEAHVRTAAKLAIVRAARTGAGLDVAVSIENQTGHKLPTGHPSRRMWLHVRVTANGGATVFESGRADAYGRLVDAAGRVLDRAGSVLLHRDVVHSDAEVQVYESVPGDDAQHVVTTLIDATAYLKDNRLLPVGYSTSHPNNVFTHSVGTAQDPNFGSTDTVTYAIDSVPTGPVVVEVELLHQSVKPAAVEALAAAPTPAALRLFDMVSARPPLPVSIASVRAEIP